MRKFGIVLTQLILVITLFILNTTKTIKAEEVYVDEELGISFSIPSGWEAIGLSKEDRQFAKERFSTGENGEVLVYMSADIYELLKNQDLSIKKEDVLGYRMNINDAKKMFNDSYGFEKYYTRHIEGIDWCVSESSLFTAYTQFINGNMVSFMYTSFMSDERVNQVKDIIKEVSTREFEKEKKALGETGIGSGTQQKPNNQPIEQETKTLMIHGLIWVAIGVAYWWFRNLDKQVKCTNCGKYNNKNNNYCVKCGNKLR